MNPAAVEMLIALAAKLGPPLLDLLVEGIEALSRNLAASNAPPDLPTVARSIVTGIEETHGLRLSGNEKRILAQRAIEHHIKSTGGTPDARAVNTLIELAALPWGVAKVGDA